MKGCTEFLFRYICRGERRFFLLNTRPIHVPVSPYSFRICCISCRIDVVTIRMWFRTQRFTFPFTITLYTVDSCHSFRMSVYKKHVGSSLCKDSAIWYSVMGTESRHNKLQMVIIAKIDAYFVLHIILIISVTIISHNWHKYLISVSVTGSNHQVHRTPRGANASVWLNRLGQLPLSDRKISHYTYYSNTEEIKKSGQTFATSQFRPALRNVLWWIFCSFCFVTPL
jgi:hypothetical protein